MAGVSMVLVKIGAWLTRGHRWNGVGFRTPFLSAWLSEQVMS
jgi:hypothetical protein